MKRKLFPSLWQKILIGFGGLLCLSLSPSSASAKDNGHLVVADPAAEKLYIYGLPDFELEAEFEEIRMGPMPDFSPSTEAGSRSSTKKKANTTTKLRAKNRARTNTTMRMEEKMRPGSMTTKMKVRRKQAENSLSSSSTSKADRPSWPALQSAHRQVISPSILI